MSQVEQIASDRIELIRKACSVVLNEFLFCIFYYLSEWKRPITIQKLSKDSGVDEVILADHLQILVGFGFILSSKGKFQITAAGKEAIRFVEEGLGRRPYHPAPAIPAEVCSELTLLPDAEADSSDREPISIPLNIVIRDFEALDVIHLSRVKAGVAENSPGATMFSPDEVARTEDASSSLDNL
ncbi:MAG: hypothetical protein ACREQ7_22520 [Candidatus Binatia bacterium]